MGEPWPLSINSSPAKQLRGAALGAWVSLEREIEEDAGPHRSATWPGVVLSLRGMAYLERQADRFVADAERRDRRSMWNCKCAEWSPFITKRCRSAKVNDAGYERGSSRCLAANTACKTLRGSGLSQTSSCRLACS